MKVVVTDPFQKAGSFAARRRKDAQDLKGRFIIDDAQFARRTTAGLWKETRAGIEG